MSHRRNYTESELRQIRELEEKIKFGDEFTTTEELCKQKLQSIAKGRKSQFKLPMKEVYKMSNGERKEVFLHYNTKKGNVNLRGQKYKTEICRHYPNCSHGSRCNFAHGLEELETYKKLQQCLKKYSELVKVRKLDHFELCQNQQCPVRLRILLKKTVICQYFEEDRCFKTTSMCCYAHGENDLKPLPKYERCKNHMSGQCHLEEDECVYAHSRKELRIRGAHPELQTSSSESSDYESDDSSSSSSNKELEDDSANESKDVEGENSLVSIVLECDESDWSPAEENQEADDLVLCESCVFLRDNLPDGLKAHYFTFLKRRNAAKK